MSKGTGAVIVGMFGAILLAECSTLISYYQGKLRGIDNMRSQATEAGVARFTCDPTTGDSTFEWIKPEKKNETTND